MQPLTKIKLTPLILFMIIVSCKTSIRQDTPSDRTREDNRIYFQESFESAENRICISDTSKVSVTDGKLIFNLRGFFYAETASSAIFTVDLPRDAILSFDFKPESYSDATQSAGVNISDSNNGSPQCQLAYLTGSSDWRPSELKLSAGHHVITLSAVNGNGVFSPQLSNRISFDNLMVAADLPFSIELPYQKYIVTNNSLPLPRFIRPDGREYTGSSVPSIRYIITDGSGIPQELDSTTLLIPGSVYKIHAIAGKMKSNEIKLIIPSEGTIYFSDRFFKGAAPDVGAKPLVPFKEGTDILLSGVSDKNNADAFFSLGITNPGTGSRRFVLAEVFDPSGQSQKYFIEGSKKENIWLTRGSGKYLVWIYDINVKEESNGRINKYSHSAIPLYDFTVNNLTETSFDKFPSQMVPCSDYYIQNLVYSILYNRSGSDYDPREKALKITKYITSTLQYDHASAADDTKRKKQDIFSVLESRIAICEGYALMAVTMIRVADLKSKFISGLAFHEDGTGGSHGWTQICINNEWLLLDVTWADPVSVKQNGKFEEDDPYNFSDKYIFIQPEGIKGSHSKGTVEQF